LIFGSKFYIICVRMVVFFRKKKIKKFKNLKKKEEKRKEVKKYEK